jgi:pilus assembly protein Flp/PilA
VTERQVVNVAPPLPPTRLPAQNAPLAKVRRRGQHNFIAALISKKASSLVNLGLQSFLAQFILKLLLPPEKRGIIVFAHLSHCVVNFLKREDGPTAVEYAVMLSLILVFCISAISTLGSTANATFTSVGNAVGS